MKRFCSVGTLLLLGVVVCFLSLPEPSVTFCWAGTSPPIQKSPGVNNSNLGGVPMVCGTSTIGYSCATNGFYKVYVTDHADPAAAWNGQYTVATGVLHPAVQT